MKYRFSINETNLFEGKNMGELLLDGPNDQFKRPPWVGGVDHQHTVFDRYVPLCGCGWTHRQHLRALAWTHTPPPMGLTHPPVTEEAS